ncbi:MAG: ABC transporter substrate-binding protein [Chloroflexi bacterium]|nr:ABC transporter substrate-binding protein [Chloroflexota bacterium]
MATWETRKTWGQPRLTRRGFLLKAAGASAALVLTQACQSSGPPPSYGGSGSVQQTAPASGSAPTQAPAAAPATQAPAGVAASKPAANPAANPTPAAQASSGGQPKRGGTLITAVTAEPPTLDPHLGFPQNWTSLLYDYLVYFDKDNKVQPNLAESWDVRNDGAELVFHLRKGVKFHNGREVVADDVKYSIERLQQKTSVFSGDYAAIQAVEVVDPHTARMSFARPFPGIFRMLAQFKGGEIVAKEAVEKNGDLARTAMGTGPFMFDHWTPGNEIVLKRNPNYWRQGLPYLDGVTFKIIPDEAGIVAGLRTGAVHHMQILDFTNVAALKAEPNVTVYRIPRVQDGVVAMYVNARIGSLADPKVREALYWAFDRDATVKIATGGLGIATGPISPTVTPWALPDDVVKQWWRRDLDKAKQAVAEAKASGKYPDGIKTEVWADATTRWRVDTAQILSSNAKEAGIDCEVVMMESGTITKRFLAREAPIYPNTWGASAIDPDAMYRFLNTKGQDYPYVNDPDVDQMLETGRYTWDPSTRKQVYDKIQNILLERYHGIWMYHVDYYDAARKNVHYTRDKYPPMGLRGLEETWIE